MEGRKSWIGPSNWVLMLFRVYIILSLGRFTSGALLNGRQADDFSEDNPDDSEDPSVSTSIAETAPGPTAVTEPSRNATTASNGTIKASSLSSADAVATTASSALNSTNDPNMCHKTYTANPEGNIYIDNDNPFCKPYEGQEVFPNIRYQVTWDPTLFEDGANNTVQVYDAEASALKSPATADILASRNATNYQGSVFINMSSLWLKGQSAANLTLALVVDQDGTDPKVFAGPTFTLLSTASSDDGTHAAPSSAPSSGGAKKLGEKVGIPVGLVFLLVVVAAAVALFVCVRKRRGRAKGYGAGKSLRQRVGGAGGGHRRDASFHDEPTAGVELRDRNKRVSAESGQDNWDWGSPVSSPTSAGGGNAFRDEIQRQRSGR